MSFSYRCAIRGIALQHPVEGLASYLLVPTKMHVNERFLKSPDSAGNVLFHPVHSTP